MHGRLHMQYLADHGTWSDLPLGKIREDLMRHYPAALFETGARQSPDLGRFEDDAGH
jgi:hypothetical protein